MRDQQDEPYHISIEIENRHCKVLETLRNSGVKRFQIVDVRGLGDVTRHLVRMPLKQINNMPEEIPVKTQRNSRSEKETSAWIDSKGCNVCTSILSKGAFLVSGENIGEHTLIYSFIAPSFDAFRSTISELEGKGLKPKILEVGKFKPKGDILTQRQERVLWLALRMGFFEYPRKVNTAELSKRLGISTSTLSEITRRGTRRILENYFEV